MPFLSGILRRLSTACFILLLLASFKTTAIAQENLDSTYLDESYRVDRFLVHAGVGRVFPQGSFQEHIEARWGGTLSFYTRISRQFPFFAGIHSDLATFNRYSENYFLTDEDGFLFEVEERTQTKLLNLHAVLRTQPYFDFFLHPYAEILMGTSHIYTRTIVEDLEAPDDDNTISNTGRNAAWALSVGGTVGLNIPLLAQDTGGLELDLKCTYLKGGNATYTVLKDELLSTYQDTLDAFDLKTSKTDMLLVQLGLLFYFGG